MQLIAILDFVDNLLLFISLMIHHITTLQQVVFITHSYDIMRQYYG